ncbi:hypothetical protein ASE72_01165 [Sphingomonas sp. Leaf20]|nr:hypothetical protein ASE72_01165 [Sphingomonas sp. Leaf20]
MPCAPITTASVTLSLRGARVGSGAVVGAFCGVFGGDAFIAGIFDVLGCGGCSWIWIGGHHALLVGDRPTKNA